jgi:hypothetical protein
MAEKAYTEALEVSDHGLVRGARIEILHLLKLLPEIAQVQSILNLLSVNQKDAHSERTGSAITSC